MKKISIFILIKCLMILLLCGCFNANNYSDGFSAQKNEGNIEKNDIIIPSGTTLAQRFAEPEGYQRVACDEESFTHFLRNYEMKQDGSEVLLYDGSPKWNQKAHAGIFTLPIENADLQQCADSVMRMYAEYYWHNGEHDKIVFHFTDGFLFGYSKWKEGYRVVVDDGETRWTKSASWDDSYENFVKYLRMVFSYSGTASMEQFEADTIALSEMRAGDVILKGGSPGHVVMVVDVCQNDDGKKAFLLAQGYMPAQEFHVIKNPMHHNDPWYYEEEIEFPLETMEYTFDEEDMIKRLSY